MFALLFDLGDYATTYRATRDAYLKAANGAHCARLVDCSCDTPTRGAGTLTETPVYRSRELAWLHPMLTVLVPSRAQARHRPLQGRP